MNIFKRNVNLLQYFKSIEQVAASQGFVQSLPSAELTLKKRDSVLEKLDSPKSATSKNFLAASKAGVADLSRVEPANAPLEAMHGRVDSPQG